MSSPRDIEKMLGGALPKDTVQEAMETHKPFGSSVFVSTKPVNVAPKLRSTEIQIAIVASHVEESTPSCKKLGQAIGFLTNGTHVTPNNDTFPKLQQGGNC